MLYVWLIIFGEVSHLPKSQILRCAQDYTNASALARF